MELEIELDDEKISMKELQERYPKLEDMPIKYLTKLLGVFDYHIEGVGDGSVRIVRND